MVGGYLRVGCSGEWRRCIFTVARGRLIVLYLTTTMRLTRRVGGRHAEAGLRWLA
jgi:hypothetical protein